MSAPLSLRLHVQYGFVLLAAAGESPDLDDSRAGQSNGLCGAAVPGALAMMTGTHTGVVSFEVHLIDSEPRQSPEWEDVVEVSFTPEDTELYLSTLDDSTLIVFPQARTYRARYCASGLDQARDATSEIGEIGPDRYRLVLWPGEDARDTVIRSGSSTGRYWHQVATDTAAPASSPPSPRLTTAQRVENARAATRRREEREQEQRQLHEQRLWGGMPSERLRHLGGGVIGMFRQDPELTEALAAAPPAVLHDIVQRLVVKACEQAAHPLIDWTPALDAVTQGQAIPPPFDDFTATWKVAHPEPRRTATLTARVVRGPRARIPIAPISAAVAALRSATDPDPARAAVVTLSNTASALADPATLYREVGSWLTSFDDDPS